jgi:hypothetical protein
MGEKLRSHGHGIIAGIRLEQSYQTPDVSAARGDYQT